MNENLIPNARLYASQRQLEFANRPGDRATLHFRFRISVFGFRISVLNAVPAPCEDAAARFTPGHPPETVPPSEPLRTEVSIRQSMEQLRKKPGRVASEMVISPRWNYSWNNAAKALMRQDTVRCFINLDLISNEVCRPANP